jgi:hypothetical protein
MKLQMYGLLHLDDKQQSAMNFQPRDFAEQLLTYVRNAINLSNSLQSQGVSFTLLTNKKNVIYECMQSEQRDFQVKEIPFITEVPSGTKFYSAHFKLDAFRYLSTLSGNYVGLCDLDMVCINDYPLCLNNIVNAGLPLSYDISDQVIPAYGHAIIIKDLKLIHGLESEGRWYGGEFISGTQEFFARLVEEIEEVYASYIANIPSMHAVNDEAFTSAALELLRRKGVCIGDAGTLGIVGRFWNAAILHPQKPFDYYRKCFLLHLPADKRFLAEIVGHQGVAPNDFLRIYAAHRKGSLIKKAARKVRSLLKGILPNNMVRLHL